MTARNPLFFLCALCPLWLVFFALVFATRGAEPAATDGRLVELGSRSVRTHDPSTIVRHKETYWLFYTGRGAPSYSSTDLLTWTAGPRIFTNSPAWVTNAVPRNRGGLDFWAPDVIEHNGRYLVYYSVSTFGRNTSAIALASNKSLDPSGPDFAWTDEGIAIQSASTNDFNAIDPAVTLDKEKRLWMSFGSFWSGIKLVELDPATGKRKAEAPLHSIARKKEIEAPFIYHQGDHYYLFVNWGVCCRGTNSTYNIRIGRSEKITGPYLDKEGVDMAQGGGSLFLETDGDFIGPGHAGIVKVEDQYWMSLHFYDGTRRGMSTLALRPLTWQTEGWPAVQSKVQAAKPKETR